MKKANKSSRVTTHVRHGKAVADAERGHTRVGARTAPTRVCPLSDSPHRFRNKRYGIVPEAEAVLSSYAGTPVGVGIDVCEPARIRASIAKLGDRFLRRIFTPREITYCRAMKRAPELRFAARFAAKEAAAKALGTGISAGIRWTEIEVVHDATGSPGLVLTGHAATIAKKRGVNRWLISLTHTDSAAVAVALAFA